MGRPVDLSLNAEPIRPKWLIVGPHKVGKTLLAATWPRPYFITVSADQGKDTIPRGRGVGCWEADSWADVDNHTEEVHKKILQGQFPYDTVIFDGLSFMGDYAATAARAGMESALAKKGKKVAQEDTWAMFRTVLMQFTAWVLRVQSMPVHVVFVLHTAPIYVTFEGVRTEQGYQIDFPGSFKTDLERMVFGTIDMQPILQSDGQTAIRSFLTRQPGRLSALRKDGRFEGTGIVAPPFIDNLSFPILAGMLTAVGVPVMHAPNLVPVPAGNGGDQVPAGGMR